MQPEQGPQHFKFGGGVSETVLHPAVLILILIAGVLICIWPRQKAAAAFLAASLLIPMDQVLLVGPAHFPMLRVLVFFGFFRIVRDRITSKIRLFSSGVNALDVAVILLTVFVALNGILLFQVSGAVINELGQLYTVFGVYFLLRFLIRNEEDVVSAIQTLAWIAAVVAIIMAYEITTGHNPYALLGGAEAAKYASLVARDDRFRAQGPFAHSITAGTFGAVLVPLFVALWWKATKYRKIAVLGLISATVITLACNSSTPVLAYAAGVLALCFWPLRRRMRLIRWGIVIILVVLQLVLKNPVWHLITRIDITGGSSSWHRYMLIDQCIRHFGDWWLIGVKDTSVWGWDMWDTANQYVGLCDSSGLLPFLLFVATLVYGFKFVGKARRAASRMKDKQNALFFWAIGSALFANVVAFLGISYFDQSMVAWYAFLAMLSAAVAIRRKESEKNKRHQSAWDEGVIEERESNSPALA
ncbi:MAG: hypothetical protein WCC95_10530 [Candidatus Sulfotelmatobacter sp.]